jgi:hypothetical protein
MQSGEHMAQRERERKRRGKRKYGQAKLKHSKRGIYSCALSGVVFVILTSLIAGAYFNKGTSAPFIGAMGLISLMVSCYSLYIGLRGFKEREKNYLTCKIGVGCSSLFILGFIIIFFRGLF